MPSPGSEIGGLYIKTEVDNTALAPGMAAAKAEVAKGANQMAADLGSVRNQVGGIGHAIREQIHPFHQFFRAIDQAVGLLAGAVGTVAIVGGAFYGLAKGVGAVFSAFRDPNGDIGRFEQSLDRVQQRYEGVVAAISSKQASGPAGGLFGKNPISDADFNAAKKRADELRVELGDKAVFGGSLAVPGLKQQLFDVQQQLGGPDHPGLPNDRASLLARERTLKVQVAAREAELTEKQDLVNRGLKQGVNQKNDELYKTIKDATRDGTLEALKQQAAFSNATIDRIAVDISRLRQIGEIRPVVRQ